MARRTDVTVVIFDSRIKALGAPTNMVGQYVGRKGDTIERWATIMAPKRSGALARSIHEGPVEWFGGNRTSVTVSADAGYANFVHNGTTGPIHGRRKGGKGAPRGMLVPIHWSITGTGKRAWRQEVAGQAAQPFLADALTFVMGGSRFVRTRSRNVFSVR